jgi:hypothetical protein
VGIKKVFLIGRGVWRTNLDRFWMENKFYRWKQRMIRLRLDGPFRKLMTKVDRWV